MPPKHITNQLIKYLKSSIKSKNYLFLTFFLLLTVTILFISINYSNYHTDWTGKPYQVIEVVDGDTIEVQGVFFPFRVRYIGIDTPEIGRNGKSDDCYAQEARNYNAQLLISGEVYLEPDMENKDRFERELRYIYVKNNDGKLLSVNESMLANGYADTLFISPNTKYKEKYTEIRNEAKNTNIGKWGVCQ